VKLTIFGANGPTGRATTRMALAAGHEVVAATRRPDDFPAFAGALTVAEVDVHDPARVTAAISGADAVISALGVPFGRKPVAVYSAGFASISAGMREHGVSRFVGVTSSTMDLPPNPANSWFFERVLQPFVVRVLGRTVYDDMHRMEAAVRTSGLDWTLVRPFGLFDRELVGSYDLSDNHLFGRFTSRADLADVLLRLATSEEHIGEAVEVLTTSDVPRFVDFFLKEGLSSKS
jgi:uncharacterized protein YbjT (DUF2867 family)